MTERTSGPVSYSVCRAVFQEARPGCVTAWPSLSVLKHGRCQLHGYVCGQACWPLLLCSLVGSGEPWPWLCLRQNHDYGAELWVTAVFSCVAWWWKLRYIVLNLLTPLNSCSFDKKISVLKWEEDPNGKNNEACSSPLFTFLFLLPSIAQNKQLQLDISASQICY